MCENCIAQARRAFENWPADQQIIARRALARSEEPGFIRNYTEGRDTQLAKDTEQYRKSVSPHRRQLLAAVEQAEEQIRTGRSAVAVLDMLLTNVRTDATAIPATLPI